MRAQHTLRCKGIPSVLNRTKFGIPSTRRVGVFSRPRTKTASRVVVMETGEHTACVRAWSELQEHFRHHAGLVRRFRRADAQAVARMWNTGRNEFGQPLTSFEREALTERHCELFGDWPT
jgi:hypothetical protein